MITKLVLHKGYIKAYYAKNYKAIRHNLDIKARKQELNKRGLFKPNARQNWKELNEEILNRQQVVDNLILKQGQNPDLEKVKHFLKKKASEQPKKTRLVDLYREYLDFKMNIENKITEGSGKTYKIWLGHLLDYELWCGKEHHIDDVNEDWLHGLRNMLHSKVPSNYHSKGRMNNNTAHRRFKGFRSFWNWMVRRNFAVPNAAITHFKVETYPSTFIALTDTQLNALASYQPKLPFHCRVKDIFIVLCYTGMRISDYLDLQPEHIKDGYIEKKAIKTKALFKVPIHEKVKAIYEKYNDKFYKINAGKINSELKVICKEIPEFHQLVEEVNWIGKEKVVKKKPLWQCISSHAGRHTAATRALLSGIPHNVVMQWCGWANPGQLFEYAEKIGLDSHSYMKKL